MRILLITLSNIGDAVMTTPVLAHLHALHPEARIDLVADRRSSRLFEACPFVGEIHHKDKKRGWRGVLALVRTLRRQRYDLIVDLRTDGLALLLRARRRLMKWGRRPHGPHAVEDLISIIDPINPAHEIPPVQLCLDEGARAAATALLAGLPGTRHLAIGPGANWPPKIWPAERFAELANRLADHFDGCVLLGGAADRDRCRAVSERLDLPAVDISGRTDLLTAAAALEACDLFIGNDSGLGHMAAAVGTPTLTLFGPGEPERYHPWSPTNRYLVQPQRDLARLEVDSVLPVALELVNP